MNDSELKARTIKFAHSCVKLAMEFPNSKLGQHIEGQLIRCATSVAANYRAACLAQSSKSFVSKLSIVIEEVDESNFWIVFAKEESLINPPSKFDALIQESKELTAIFIASRKTLQSRINNQ
ncbi:MAG: four helix bundle protein [Salinivirgaceae bacterium]